MTDEGTWWYEMNLPRAATREQIQARYADLRHQRRGCQDDLERLHHAYAVAILHITREDAADACHDRHFNEGVRSIS